MLAWMFLSLSSHMANFYSLLTLLNHLNISLEKPCLDLSSLSYYKDLYFPLFSFKITVIIHFFLIWLFVKCPSCILCYKFHGRYVFFCPPLYSQQVCLKQSRLSVNIWWTMNWKDWIKCKSWKYKGVTTKGGHRGLNSEH